MQQARRNGLLLAARRLLLAAGLGLLLTACGGDGGDATPQPDPGGGEPAPTMTLQPQPQTVDDGAAATFTVAASGNALSYQWQRDGNAIAGATGAALTLPAVTLADDGANLRAVVTNSGGSVTSDAVRLTVRAVPPSITSAPTAASVVVGQTASFTVAARGSAPLGYQWQRNGVDIAGATAASYTTAALGIADSGAAYTVKVSNAAGTVTSVAAGLSVTAAPLPLRIITQPLAASAQVGQTATFSVAAEGTGTLHYQWRRDGNDIAGATLASYTTPVLTLADHAAVFTVRVADAAGAVLSEAVALTVTAVAPRSPLAGRAWTAGVRLASDITFTPLVGVADDGKAVVVGVTRLSPFGAPFVVYGEPGGAGAVQWSQPLALSSLGTRSGAPVPSNLRVLALRVAANGRAVMLAVGGGGGCPSVRCRFVAMLDPVQRTWSPWDVVDVVGANDFPTGSRLLLNDRGDLALFVSADGTSDQVTRVFWRGASEIGLRSLELGPTGGATSGPQSGELTLDEAGAMVLAIALQQNSTTDIALWRGDVAGGLRGPTVVDTRAAPASLYSLWTSRSGRSFLMWRQNNGTADSLYGARFDTASASIAAEDLGPALLPLAMLPPLATSVTDGDVLVAPRANGSSTCATLRWPFVGAVQLVDASQPCNMAPGGQGNVGTSGWGRERNGNVLSVGKDFTWGTYDAELNRQIDAPIDANSVASGPGYVIGVRRPQNIWSFTAALSRSGIGLVVITADLDTWPTPASPAGDGRPGVTNLWATYFK